jgi:hypothetical protein
MQAMAAERHLGHALGSRQLKRRLRQLRLLILQPDFVTCGKQALDAERPPLDDHGL